MRIALAFLFAAATVDAMAADSTPELARACVECHAAGNQQTSLPQLQGQNAAYLRMELTHFRERNRDAFPMNAIAHDLADADIAALGAWFAAQPWRAFDFAADPARVAAGAQQVERFQCAACHGAGFTGTDVIPRTAGQNPLYLARQLRAFAAGERYHPPTGTGARMFRLEEDEIDALAQYLAQLKPASAPE